MKNLPLKILSFILAFVLWFYIVSELNRGSQEELQALHKLMQRNEAADQRNYGKIRR